MRVGELDVGKYLDLFLQEAGEQLDVLESQTLGLESDGDLKRVQAMFRAAHTIKGSSRAMGFAHIADLTHEMENILDGLRDGTLSLSPEIVTELLRGNDLLGQQMEDVRSFGETSRDPRELVAALRALQHAGGESTPGGAMPLLKAEIVLESTCALRFASALLAVQRAEEVGELVRTVPDREALEDERFEDRFEIWFMCDESPEALAELFLSVGDVASCTVVPAALPTECPVVTKPIPMQQAQSAPSTATRRPDTGPSVRVDVSRMDELMDLVGELVIDRTRLAQLGASISARHPGEEGVEQLQETVAHFGRVTSGLQESILKVRMLPIETVFSRFPRTVRDLAANLHKDVVLEMRGGDTEIDRSVLEIIGDPILHILRNCLDHGIESPDFRVNAGKNARGTVHLSARHSEGQIIIDIEDDGGGIDVERVKAKAVERGIIDGAQAASLSEQDAVNLVFSSGLSTATDVSDVSGRGVGMDIVKANIQRLGGMIDVQTRLGKGTRFTFRLPLTLAIIRGLLVRVARSTFVVPLGSIVETLLVKEAAIQTLPRNEVLVIRGSITPLIRLRRVFQSQFANEPEPESDKRYIVVIGVADQRVGLVVDGLAGEQEVVIKSLTSNCSEPEGVSGATNLGDGTVALIVDVNSLVAREAA